MLLSQPKMTLEMSENPPVSIQPENELISDSPFQGNCSLNVSPTENSPPKTDIIIPPAFSGCDPEQRALLEEILPTFNYTETSIYLGSAKNNPREEYMPCTCKITRDSNGNRVACGENSDCINRLLLVECTKGICPGGKFCKNQRFQKIENAPLKLIKTEKKGYGLEATGDISEGQFIMEYVGEVVSYSNFIRRAEKYHEMGAKHFYFMSLKSDKIIDATKAGSLARFINHSCNPNCILQKWMIGSRIRIGIFSRCGIKKGEELTFDYQFERYGAEAQQCYCGESNCKGMLGGEKQTELRGIEELSDDIDNFKLERGFSSEEEFSKLVKIMLQIPKPELALPLVEKLKKTDDPKVYKIFIRLHGLVALKTWLVEFKDDEQICTLILYILESLPFASRNKIAETDIINTLKEYSEGKDPAVQDKITVLVQNWESLPLKYVIPKLGKNSAGADSDTQKEDSSGPGGHLKRFVSDSNRSSPSLKSLILENSERLPFGLSNGSASSIRQRSFSITEAPSKSSLSLSVINASQLRNESTTFQDESVECDSPFSNDLGNFANPSYAESRHIPGSLPEKRGHAGISNSMFPHNGSLPSHQMHQARFGNLIRPGPFLHANKQQGQYPFNFQGGPQSLRHNQPHMFRPFPSSNLPFEHHPEPFFPLVPEQVPNNSFHHPIPFKHASMNAQPSMFRPPITATFPQTQASAHNTSSNFNTTHSVTTITQTVLEQPFPSQDPTLPEHWFSASAPNGKIYYYHGITKETTWEKPVLIEKSTMDRPHLSPAFLPEETHTSLNANITGDITNHLSTNSTTQKGYTAADGVFITEHLAISSNGSNFGEVRSDNSSKRQHENGESLDSRSEYKKLQADSSTKDSNSYEKRGFKKDIISRCRKMLSIEVVNAFNPYYKKLTKELFKKHAERMTNLLVEKEMRLPCYKEGTLRKMMPSTRDNIKAFVKSYAEKLVQKKEDYEKSLETKCDS